ncbi:MAG TPA: lipoyl(octanoyl) transferase LipB [Geobacteraceae bacterium]|nr:lipoyl(octanoyl) transferase LipB [Geobacteraceae bacterium]
MKILDFGVMDFGASFAIQEQLVEALFGGMETETLLLLEHMPVYTMGRGGSEDNILDAAIEPVRINRGGDVTFHGPGQLVGYPIIDLDMRGRDLHRYLRFLEELLIRVAADYAVEARRVTGRTGVWTGKGKLASIGVGVRRWITMHGFALNVSTDLAGFSAINPCGIEACPVTSLKDLLGAAAPAMQEVKAAVMKYFEPLLDECLPVLTNRAAGKALHR